MRTKKFHIILFLMIWNFSFAQEYTNFSVTEGLPSNHVYRLVQDKKGFIWVFTDKGLARFNGTEFRTFTTRDGLPTNDIWDLRIGPDNKVWYFSKSPSLGYILNDSVYNFPSCKPNTAFYPSSTFQMGNTFVFGNTAESIALIDGCWQTVKNIGEIKLPLEKNKILSEKEKRDVLTYLQSSVDEIFDIDEANWVLNTRFVSHDSLLVMIYSDGYNIYNINTGKTYSGNMPMKLTPQYAYFNRVTFANDEIQLTGFGFLAPLKKDYSISEVIKIPGNLQAHFSFRDRTGNIWAATFANGIYMLPQIKKDIVYLLQGRKVKLFCTKTEPVIANVLDDGFYEYNTDAKNFEQLVSEKGFIYSAKYIPELQTNYLISESHIFVLNQNGKIKKVSNKTLAIKNISFCNGYLYGTTSHGLYKIDSETLAKVDSYEQYGVMDLILFQNKLVLGTSSGLAFLENERIQNINSTAELFQKPILKLYKTADNLLLVCTDGFGAYLTDFEKALPLPGSEYLSIETAFIEHNEIWLTSEVGVLHYSKIGEEYQLTEKLDENNGLLSKRINSIVALEKEIMLGTDNGVVIIPKNQKKTDQVLDVYFTVANFNSQSLLGKKKTVRYASNNDLTIGVSSIDYSQSGQDVSFEYKLMPAQTDWSKTTSKDIHFSDLPPNDYQIWIKKGTIEKSMHFSILPLWWQRIESKIALGLLMLLFVATVIYKYQKFQIKKRFRALITQKKLAENELYALRAQMNPHFVFNSLAAIQYYINENDFATSEKYLVKFSKLIRQFFELSRVEEITLETEIGLLQNYLDIEKLRFKEKLAYHIKLDPFLNMQETKIPSMLLQPIVENAVNHGIFNKGKSGHIDLNFTNIANNEFLVEIVDNGVGFANSKKKQSGRISSSTVLQNRLDILNRSKQWVITFSNREAYPDELDVGNISTFKIKKTQ
ncbi:hypothetical protein G3O08_01395 [Cryomorpha ignava]|uniref:Signal transduction histidine kinase internal region domain-containing protein n=1 Tax=Cryomorpha ignava TaxID=101383 RepID=A0A7K3WKI2_9FLAO|nr:histidine kinase [Cryomorpha ignava]NEN22156.1 hypothetical protein [Cryomorpha ignava]